MQDDGFLEPVSKVYNFMSKPTLAIHCETHKGIDQKESVLHAD